jgi:hypothetical protein
MTLTPDGVQGTTIVDDSDDEREYPEIPIAPAPEPVSESEPAVLVEEPKTKPKVVRKKKTDA